MSEAEVSANRVDQWLIYGAYGEVMHQFQVLELTLWQVLARSLKPGMSLAQAMDKVTKWDKQTLGQIVGSLKSQAHWPEGMVDKLKKAVDSRNYLAHHFLREYFLVTPSEKVREQASQELANLSVGLEELQEALEAHLHLLGVPDVNELDEETKAEIGKIRPTDLPW